MKQADLGLHMSTKRTRKRAFLDEMERVVPSAYLIALIAGVAPEGKRGSPPFALHTLLRITCPRHHPQRYRQAASFSKRACITLNHSGGTAASQMQPA
jgi:hypothetical protein